MLCIKFNLWEFHFCEISWPPWTFSDAHCVHNSPFPRFSPFSLKASVFSNTYVEISSGILPLSLILLGLPLLRCSKKSFTSKTFAIKKSYNVYSFFLIADWFVSLLNKVITFNFDVWLLSEELKDFIQLSYLI